jgi:hypothetical protein
MSTDVSEENIASIFRVEEYAKQETSVKAGGKQSSATSSSEMSADFQRTTRRYILEDRTLQFRTLSTSLYYNEKNCVELTLW